MSENDKTIDYIELPAADLEAAQSFYGALLGWTFESYGPEYLAFADGRMNGGFYKSENRSSVAAGGALVVIYASDLEAVRDQAVSLGGTITRDIFDFPGGRRFHFEDPNGNELAVWSEPLPG